MALSEYFILTLFVALGIFSMIAAACNMEWYFRTDGARLFVRHLGRNGARLFYFLLGVALVACGVAGFICWWP